MPNTQEMVLVVDDMELNRAILTELLKNDYGILEAENGREALELLERHREDIQLVLTDIVMPVMDGFELLEAMESRRLLERIPVVLITAESTDQAIARGFDMGVSDVITKPINPSIVRHRAHNIIELNKHRNDLESIIRRQTWEIEEKSRQLRETNLSIVDTLSTAVEFRDCESGQHIQRIRRLTKVLLTELVRRHPGQYPFSQREIENISVSSAMHDVGKIAIPDYILNKPGRLTAEEFEIMKQHTVRGCEILERIDSLKREEAYQYCYDICRWHHEKWDGRGYPDGLAGNDIPIWAQIVALADCYDALTSERVYKAAYSHRTAVNMIAGGECGLFNPQLLTCFTEVADDLPAYFAEKEDQSWATA